MITHDLNDHKSICFFLSLVEQFYQNNAIQYNAKITFKNTFYEFFSVIDKSKW